MELTLAAAAWTSRSPCQDAKPPHGPEPQFRAWQGSRRLLFTTILRHVEFSTWGFCVSPFLHFSRLNLWKPITG